MEKESFEGASIPAHYKVTTVGKCFYPAHAADVYI